jgi:hypothetical protein
MSIYLFGEKAKAVIARSRSEDILQAKHANDFKVERPQTYTPPSTTVSIATSQSTERVLSKESEPTNSDSGQIQRSSSSKLLTTAELPALHNRDDHRVRTLVAARCSALYLRTNFASTGALGSTI